MDDSAAVIYALQSADASSGLHEMAHVLRRNLRKPELDVTLEWVNSQLRRTEIDGQPVQPLPEIRLDRYGNFRGRADSVVTAEELFAEAHEQYFREGRAPTKAMEKVFKIMKELLRNILVSLSVTPMRLDISREMYGVFDKVYGASDELDFSQLFNISRYYATQRTLSGSQLRRAGRLESDLVVESDLTDRFRQKMLSLQEYSSRIAPFKGWQYRAEVEAAKLSKPGRVGARGIGTGPRTEDYGPVTRRFLSQERGARIVGGEATSSDVAVQKFLAGADVGVVALANTAVFIPYVMLYGSDAMMALRSTPAAARPLMYGLGRELEEFNYGLTVLANDVSQRVGAARARGIDDIISYLQGHSVYLLTGAERGTRTKGTFVKSGDAFFRMLDQMLSQVDAGALEELASQSQLALSGDLSSTTALTGFWKGFSVKLIDRQVGEGLLLNGAYTDLVMERAVKGDTIDYNGPAQDLLADLFKIIQGESVGNNMNAGVEAQKVAALLMFHAGRAEFKQNAVTVTLDMAQHLGGESTQLGLLMRGASFEVDGVTVNVPGLLDLTSHGNAVRSLLAIGMHGAMSDMMADAVEIGLGVTSGQFRSYAKYVSGQRATMTPEQIAEAEGVAQKFGLSIDFQRLESRVGSFYVPKPVLRSLRGAASDGERLLALRGDTPSEDTGRRLLGWLHQVLVKESIFGSIVAKPTFRLASLLDASLGAASLGGFFAGAATGARMGAAYVLGIGLDLPVPVVGGALTLERLSDIADAIPQRARSVFGLDTDESGRVVQGLKQKLRDRAAVAGDEVGRAITELASQAKYRAEVLPIMNNDPQAVFVLGGSPYRASDLRRVFARNGLYNNAFKGVTTFIRSEREMESVSPRRQNYQEALGEMSSQNRQAAQSAAESLGSPSQFLGAKIRSGTSAVLEHGLESLDAMADFERTGMAVTFMEQGVPPQIAAQMVVRAVYDYRGSLTQADRSWFKRVFVPFFGFQKNAMAHFTDLLASPRGRFFARVAGRMPRMTAEALTTLFFETIVGPYGVNTTAMNEAEVNLYYQMRAFYELGLGEDATEEDLSMFRLQLPDEAADISDEELLDYSFNGWTIREGFNGYDNVPADVRASMRYLLLGRGAMKSNGRYVKMSDVLLDREVKQRFANLGASMAVQDEASLSGFPSWAVQRYPTVQIPFPVMTNSINEMRKNGLEASVGLMLPDNFVNAGFEQTAATIATTVAIFRVLGTAGSVALGDATAVEVEMAARYLLNSAEPLVDIRGGGAPLTQTLLESKGVLLDNDSMYVELDPFIARMLDGTLVPVGEIEGDDDLSFLESLSPRTRSILNNTLRAATVRGPFVEVATPFQEARTAVVEEVGGRRSVRYLEKDFEYLNSAYESRRSKPFLMGRDALLFKIGPLGRVNTALLRLRRSPQEDALAAEEDLQNELIRLMLSVSRSAGFRVMGSDTKMTTRIERPKLMLGE